MYNAKALEYATIRLLAEEMEFARALCAGEDVDPDYTETRRALNSFLSSHRAARDLVAICKAADRDDQGSPLQFASEHIRVVTCASSTTCRWSSAIIIDPSIPYLDQMGSGGITKSRPPLPNVKWEEQRQDTRVKETKQSPTNNDSCESPIIRECLLSYIGWYLPATTPPRATSISPSPHTQRLHAAYIIGWDLAGICRLGAISKGWRTAILLGLANQRAITFQLPYSTETSPAIDHDTLTRSPRR